MRTFRGREGAMTLMTFLCHLMKSPHSQGDRCCCCPPFSDEKTRAYETCPPLVVEPGLELKSGGFQSPCSYPTVQLTCGPCLSIAHLLGKAALVRGR